MTVTLVDDRRFPSAHLAMDFRLRASRLLQVWASLPVRAANSAATARAMLRRPSGTLNSIHSSSSPLVCMHRYTAHGLSIFPRPRIRPIARKPTTRNRPCKLTGRAGVVGGTQEIAFRLAQVILLNPGSRRWSPTVASSTASHLPQGVPRACPESCSVSAVEGSGKPAWDPFARPGVRAHAKCGAEIRRSERHSRGLSLDVGYRVRPRRTDVRGVKASQVAECLAERGERVERTQG